MRASNDEKFLPELPAKTGTYFVKILPRFTLAFDQVYFVLLQNTSQWDQFKT